MVGRLTCESERVGRIGTSSNSEAGSELDTTVRLSCNIRQWVVDRGVRKWKGLSTTKRRECCNGSCVHSFTVENRGARCAGGAGSGSGGWTRSFALLAMLAVVAPKGLLGKFFAAGLQHRTGSKATWFKAHENAVRTAKAEDICFAHGGGSLDEDVLCL